MTLTAEHVHEYAASVAALALYGAQLEGMQILLRTHGVCFPQNVLAAINDHRASGDRLVKAIEAQILELADA